VSRAERTSLLRYVAPSFDLLPTLRARIDTAEAELVELTGAQARTLRGLRSQDRAIVRGGAGTGKTLLAVDEAARYAAAGHRVLLCCRSRNLARYIAAHIEEPLVNVSDYEDLLSSLVDAAGRRQFIPEEAHEKDVLAVFLPAEAAEAVTALGREGIYGALILDEGQDLLLDGALELFDLLLDGGLDRGRWRVFLDHKQNVFSAVDLGQLKRVTGAAETQYDLLDNCRNTPQINATTCMLAALEPDDALAAEGPEVETRFVLDRREEVDAAQLVVAAWLRRGVKATDIVVVGVDEAAADRILLRWSTDVAALASLDEPQAGAVRLTTAADFKGLEALAVVVVGVRELRSRETLRQMYVACSRARVLLAVILDESARPDFETRAIEYAQRRIGN
jgi:hypothetical protein